MLARGLFKSLFALLVGVTAAVPGYAQFKPFPLPEPVEGETKAYQQVLNSLPLENYPERQLLSLDIAYDLTAGPTMLRAYIDCMRVNPLMTIGEETRSRKAADSCVASFPDHPLPRMLRARTNLYNFDKTELLTAGTDDYIFVFTHHPEVHQFVPFTELASTLRGLTAAGEADRKSRLLKAYFNPIYVPTPYPASDEALLLGIGELLDSEDTALASRLAGFLQQKEYVKTLLTFKPVSSIWPVLKMRHSQGYDAALQSWAMLEKSINDFNPAKASLLSAMDRWDDLESGARAAIKAWDGTDNDSHNVVAINDAADSLWNNGFSDRSIDLSKALIAKSNPDATGQISNAAFNAGFRMITSGNKAEGQALIRRYIAQVEKYPDNIEWQSGGAFLEALRVCASDEKTAKKALQRIEDGKGDLYSQKEVAYICTENAPALSKLIADRLNSGSMTDRLIMATIVDAYIREPLNNMPAPVLLATEMEPLKTTIYKLFQPVDVKGD